MQETEVFPAKKFKMPSERVESCIKKTITCTDNDMRIHFFLSLSIVGL